MQVRMDQHVSLDRQRTVGDLPADVSRICVEHQLAAYWGIEGSVSAELPKQGIIALRESRPGLGVAAPRHGV